MLGGVLLPVADCPSALATGGEGEPAGAPGSRAREANSGGPVRLVEEHGAAVVGQPAVPALAGRGVRPGRSRSNPDPPGQQLALEGVSVCSRLSRVRRVLFAVRSKPPSSPSPTARSAPGWPASPRSPCSAPPERRISQGWIGWPGRGSAGVAASGTTDTRTTTSPTLRIGGSCDAGEPDYGPVAIPGKDGARSIMKNTSKWFQVYTLALLACGPSCMIYRTLADHLAPQAADPRRVYPPPRRRRPNRHRRPPARLERPSRPVRYVNAFFLWEGLNCRIPSPTWAGRSNWI